jgi:hypothetical protein
MGLLVAATAESAYPLEILECYPAAFCVSVQFRDNHTAHIDTVSEGQGLVVTGLADRTVHDKDHVGGVHGFVHLLHFVEQLLFLFVTSGGVDNNDFEVFTFEIVDAFHGDLHRVRFSVGSVKRDSDFGGVLKVTTLLV